jgi:hypothetical protein
MAEYLPVIALGAVMIGVTIAYNWVKGRNNNNKVG